MSKPKIPKVEQCPNRSEYHNQNDAQTVTNVDHNQNNAQTVTNVTARTMSNL